MNNAIQLRRHEDLNIRELAALEVLFDSEYLSDYGRWDPDTRRTATRRRISMCWHTKALTWWRTWAFNVG